MKRIETRMADLAFDYTVRVSPRARFIRLYVSPQKGLEIVVPRGFDYRHLPDVLLHKSAWITRALERVRPQREELLGMPPWSVPERIQFRAVDLDWEVRSKWTPATRLSITFHRPGQIEILGPIDDEAMMRRLLGRFLVFQAEQHLPRMLQAVSRHIGLEYGRVTIRRQRARWGSCSAYKSVSLNATLLFLPYHLTRYVLVHELCHTVHLDHSKRFWSLVERHCPDYAGVERELRDARGFVPRWASVDLPLAPVT